MNERDSAPEAARAWKAEKAGMAPSICTWLGLEFNVLTAKMDDIFSQDIVHALANKPRFAGMTREFYSVAQHSVEVYQAVIRLVGWSPRERPVRRWALLHDAAEAYLTDLPAPLKNLFPDYCKIEERILGLIVERFALPPEIPAIVQVADYAVFTAERLDLMPPALWWPPRERHSAAPEKIIAYDPRGAARLFDYHLAKEWTT